MSAGRKGVRVKDKVEKYSNAKKGARSERDRKDGKEGERDQTTERAPRD